LPENRRHRRRREGSGAEIVYLELTAEQAALQKELRLYFETLMTPAVRECIEREGLDGEQAGSIRRRLGTDGWLGVGWPTEYGGRGQSPVEQLIFREEAERLGAPLPLLALDTIGPTLMKFGSEQQRAEILPRIVDGTMSFAVGYTEPEAGSDLASLRTRAVRDGDEYVINGSKLFTSYARVADYIWLAARTAPPETRHKGISIFLVPTSAPGLTITPLDTIVLDPTTVTFYDDVRVPAENLVHGENEGWRLIASQLVNERAAIGGFAIYYLKLLEDLTDWAKGNHLGGRRVIDAPWVQLSLARCHAQLQTVRLQNFRLASLAQHGALNMAEASVVKVLASETYERVIESMLEIMGPQGYQCAGSAGAQLHGRLEAAYRGSTFYTFGGGTNELQREIIAWEGLKLPRAKR
jgi:alkylation response protein AidB-like acyl-CoA dehydrogenase